MNTLTTDLSRLPADVAAATFRLSYLDLYPAPPADVPEIYSVDSLKPTDAAPYLADPVCRAMLAVAVDFYLAEIGKSLAGSGVPLQGWVDRLVRRMELGGVTVPRGGLRLQLLRARVAAACVALRYRQSLEASGWYCLAGVPQM